MRDHRAAAVLALILFGPTQAESPRWMYGYTPHSVFALTQSVETLQFGAPFSGPQHATLAIRYTPRDGTKVFLFIERGQFLCGPSRCRLSVRFDDASAVAFDALQSPDGSRTRLYLQPVGEFLRSLRDSRRVMIEASFYLTAFQSGSRYLTFEGPEGDQRVARLLNCVETGCGAPASAPL
jgi:hypothetical protein